MTILIGGVSELYQGDLDLGRVAAERLAEEELGPDVTVEDLHYGAVAVSQLLEDLNPDALILVGATARGRCPGAVERRRITDMPITDERVQAAVGDAVTGYVSMDLVVEVAAALGRLPGRTVAIEVEPARTVPSETLSRQARAGLENALEIVRLEVRRTPLLIAAHRIRALLTEGRLEPSPAVQAMDDLVHELVALDERGSWGAAFALRDRVRLRISGGETAQGMTHLDWGLWWGLIEELDRLQPLETGSS